MKEYNKVYNGKKSSRQHLLPRPTPQKLALGILSLVLHISPYHPCTTVFWVINFKGVLWTCAVNLRICFLVPVPLSYSCIAVSSSFTGYFCNLTNIPVFLSH